MGIRLQELIVPFKADTSGFAKAVTGGVLATVAALGTAMVGAFVATEKWANELDGLGDVMGGTNEQLAAFAYTARVSKVGTDAFTKANIFLEKSLLKSNGKLDVGGKKLKEYGINVKDVNGKVKDQATLTQEIADKYGKLSTAQERVNFLTEIYGKQGAQLIDFFDVLNGEGGVDALSKKMKDLGLAIDPARYENFNHNIERLKLVGLSLQVAFTEEIMPVLEGFLGWLGNVAASPKFQDISKNVKDFIKNLPNLKWEDIENIDWAKVSDNLIKGIDSVDWTKVGASLEGGIQVVIDKGANLLVAIVSKTDWWGLGNSAASAFNNFWAGMLGTDEAGLQVMVQDQINKVEGVDASPIYKKGAEIGKYFALGLQTTNSLILFTYDWWKFTTTTKIDETKEAAKAKFDNMKVGLGQKMDEIKLMFVTKAGGWISGVYGRIKETQEGLVRLISTLVDRINSILSKIISPNINFGTTGGASSSSGLSGSKRGGGNTGRASGGAMIAGQSYNIVEFNKPETFIPAVNGKMVNGSIAQNSKVEAYIDYKKLARAIRLENQRATA